jgi:hypothetical protein
VGLAASESISVTSELSLWVNGELLLDQLLAKDEELLVRQVLLRLAAPQVISHTLVHGEYCYVSLISDLHIGHKQGIHGVV